jgi:hypothetical protein
MQPASSYVDKCKLWWNPGCPGPDPRGTSSQGTGSRPSASTAATSDFTYSKTLVDQINNDPDAAVDNVLRSLDRGGEEVEKVVNSMLKVAESYPCGVAAVLAKVAKADANKYAMVSGQGCSNGGGHVLPADVTGAPGSCIAGDVQQADGIGDYLCQQSS